jgi:hypothetical protein
MKLPRRPDVLLYPGTFTAPCPDADPLLNGARPLESFQKEVEGSVDAEESLPVHVMTTMAFPFFSGTLTATPRQRFHQRHLPIIDQHLLFSLVLPFVFFLFGHFSSIVFLPLFHVPQPPPSSGPLRPSGVWVTSTGETTTRPLFRRELLTV